MLKVKLWEPPVSTLHMPHKKTRETQIVGPPSETHTRTHTQTQTPLQLLVAGGDVSLVLNWMLGPQSSTDPLMH